MGVDTREDFSVSGLAAERSPGLRFPRPTQPRDSFARPLVAAVLAVYLYVSLEWLFFVTKPSFLENLPLADRLCVLVVSPLPVVVSVVLAMAGLAAVARVLQAAPLVALARALPAAILACCVFILLDNFTYTIFKLGVVSAAGPARLAYTLLLLALLACFYRVLTRPPAPGSGQALLAGGLVAVSSLVALWQYVAAPEAPAAVVAATHRAGRLPNILLLGGDGIEAAHMSAYGYARDTTPFITGLMQHALVCENTFPNANSSGGSLTAVLTGKLPIRSHMLQYPQTLTGIHAFQHLPGILRRLGYHAFHEGSVIFTDPVKLGMRNAFDVSNRRDTRGPAWLPALPESLALAYAPDLDFLRQSFERLTERALHTVGLREMRNPRLEMRRGLWAGDEARVTALLDFFDRTPEPVFAHVHLMGPHFPMLPRVRLFSRGIQRQDRVRRRLDVYDDTIADFDRDVERVVTHLERTGKLGNTVVVVLSDHGISWAYTRVPLLFLFPDDAFAGKISSNVQLIDVAPTLLAYLGVPIPEWMEGASLLAGEPDPARRLISVRIQSRAGQPFPRMDDIGVTVCDRVLRLQPHSGLVSSEVLTGHVGACGVPPLDPMAGIALLVEQLRLSGYDVSHLNGSRAPSGG